MVRRSLNAESNSRPYPSEQDFLPQKLYLIAWEMENKVVNWKGSEEAQANKTVPGVVLLPVLIVDLRYLEGRWMATTEISGAGSSPSIAISIAEAIITA
jgi:hypothetical protein